MSQCRFLLFFTFREQKTKETFSRSPTVWLEDFTFLSGHPVVFSYLVSGFASVDPGSDADDSLRHKLPARPSEAPHTENNPAPPDTPGLKRRSLPPQRCSPLGRTAALGGNKRPLLICVSAHVHGVSLVGVASRDNSCVPDHSGLCVNER